MSNKMVTMTGLVLVAVLATSSFAVADISPEAFLLATGFDYIMSGAMYRINASTGVSHEVLSSQPYSIYAVSLDPVRQRVYWGVWQSGTIYSAHLNGSDVTTVYKLPCTGIILGCLTPDGMAVDYVERLVFYADDTKNHIAVVSTNGSNHRVLHKTEGQPYGLALDLVHEVVYYTIYAGPAMIGRVCYNGSGHTIVLNDLTAQPSGITLDRREGRLYWCSIYSKRIDSARTDGTDRRTILQEQTSTNYGFAFLAVLGDTLYFSDYESSSLRSVKKDGTGVSTLGGFLTDYVRGVVAFDPDDVVTLAQKQDANGTFCSVPDYAVTSSTTLTSSIAMTTSPAHTGTTASVSSLTSSPVVTPAPSDVPSMTTRSTTVAFDSPTSPLVIVALAVGLLVSALAVLVALVFVCRRKKFCRKETQQHQNNGDLMSSDDFYDRPGSVISHLPPPLLPARPGSYSVERNIRLASSGSSSAYAGVSELGLRSSSSGDNPRESRDESSGEGGSTESDPYLAVSSLPRSHQSLSNGGHDGGGRQDDNGGSASAESGTYRSVSRLLPGDTSHSSDGSWAANQDNRFSPQIHASENAAFDGESSGESTKYLTVTSGIHLRPDDLAHNRPRETTPLPVNEHPPPPLPHIRAMPTDVISSTLLSAQGENGSVESTPYASVMQISQSSV